MLALSSDVNLLIHLIEIDCVDPICRKLLLCFLWAVFNMGAGNPGTMMPIQQQQQHGSQGAFGNMAQSAQSLQSGIVPLQNTHQNHANFQQQRHQNQQ